MGRCFRLDSRYVVYNKTISLSLASERLKHRRIPGDLSGWGPLGEAFRLFESDGRKMVLGRAAGGAEVDRPLGTCSGWAIMASE